MQSLRLKMPKTTVTGRAQIGSGRAPTLRRLGLIVAGVAALLVPIPADVVERLYSTRVYVVVQHIATSVSNLVPVALFDVFVVTVVLGWVLLALWDVRRAVRWKAAIVRIVMRTVVWAATLYLIFLATWGLNYRRVPLTEKLAFDSDRVNPDTARRLAMIATNELNTLHDRAHAGGWVASSSLDPELAGAFERTVAPLAGVGHVVPARPKSTLLDWYFRRAAVDGMTDPFFLETMVSGDLLPFERPFVVAHEWTHLSGIADEGEANFGGWLTCLHGSPGHQYSGWLFLYSELAQALNARDRSTVMGKLDPGPRADLRAINDRIRREVSPAVYTAGWRVYDSYLRANRVEAGLASYATVVRLTLGVRFGADWTPQLRVGPQKPPS
jgi:hypothetical protein